MIGLWYATPDPPPKESHRALFKGKQTHMPVRMKAGKHTNWQNEGSAGAKEVEESSSKDTLRLGVSMFPCFQGSLRVSLTKALAMAHSLQAKSL